jgi:ligand-binding sensor domain-containing protein
MRRLLFKKSTILAILSLVFCVAVFQIFRIYQDAENKLAQSRSHLKEQNIVAFEKVHLTPHSQNSAQIIQKTTDTRDLTRFQDSYFAATDGGLLQLSTQGKTIKHFTVLDGLPESDLTSLTVFDAKLFIGTRTKGILTFDGENFTQFTFPERDPQAVTKFLDDNGRLLIATFNGGLIEFDGKVFREIKAENQTIKAINFLEKIDAKLFVGTFNSGLWIYESDVWKHFTTAEGLSSNRIIGVVKNGESLLFTTDFGLSVLENDKFRTVKILPMISSLESFENKIYVSKENGELFIFEKDLRELKKLANVEKTRFVVTDKQLFQLTDQGVFRNFKPFNQAENDTLSENFASTLAFDKNGNLWVGTFRNGIDVFTAKGKKIKHIEDDNIREINSLQLQSDEILVATSKVLWRFKSDFSGEDITKGSITHFSANTIATNHGLKIGEKLFTNVNGLPSNSTYTTLQIGKKLYVGTLGGLAEIQQNKVVRTWTDANSKLTNNWITSLCPANERFFIGTYGGGILELMPSGELHEFSSEIGKFVVNPNAIFSDDKRLFVGTLNGVKVLNYNTNKWITINDILPSEAVFAINKNDGNLYFATTNGIAKVAESYFDEVEKQ